MNNPNRRPLGVSIAVMASFLIFSLSPFLQVLLIWQVRQHFAGISSIEGFPAYAGGSEILGISEAALTGQAIMAMIFAVIALLAWLGRPPQIRWVFSGAVLVLTALQVAAIVTQGQASRSEVSAMDGLSSTINFGELFISLLVAVYVVWYLNRAPARAFYSTRKNKGAD